MNEIKDGVIDLKAGKLADLHEKWRLFSSLNLYAESAEIQRQIETIEAESIPYEIVTEQQGRDLLCPQIEKRCGGSTDTLWGPNYYEANRSGAMPWNSCQTDNHKPRPYPHKHVFQNQLGKWPLQGGGIAHMFPLNRMVYGSRPPIPVSAAILMKEAQAHGLTCFEVWAPVPFGQEKLIDPWLVGKKGSLIFKIADWR
jgi:hypothetical protein